MVIIIDPLLNPGTGMHHPPTDDDKVAKTTQQQKIQFNKETFLNCETSDAEAEATAAAASDFFRN